MAYLMPDFLRINGSSSQFQALTDVDEMSIDIYRQIIVPVYFYKRSRTRISLTRRRFLRQLKRLLTFTKEKGREMILIVDPLSFLGERWEGTEEFCHVPYDIGANKLIIHTHPNGYIHLSPNDTNILQTRNALAIVVLTERYCEIGVRGRAVRGFSTNAREGIEELCKLAGVD